MSSIDALAAMLRGRRVVALTGAGCSTESGIPDYRSGPAPGEPPADDGSRPDDPAARHGVPPRRRAPIQYREFVASEAGRRRYWARSALGWPRFRAAAPNPAHAALAALEHAGALRGVITQNVDGLHQAAGSRRVIELHGSLARVRCLGCGARAERAELQRRLQDANPGWRGWPGAAERAVVAAPDGDAELSAEEVEGFAPVACRRCGGVLKPDVVFFGENVPPPIVAEAWALFDEAELLLVAGTSLAVFSGYRFVRRAAERGVPVAIVNRGPTRGDPEATLRVDALLGDALPALADAVLGGRRA